MAASPAYQTVSDSSSSQRNRKRKKGRRRTSKRRKKKKKTDFGSRFEVRKGQREAENSNRGKKTVQPQKHPMMKTKEYSALEKRGSWRERRSRRSRRRRRKRRRRSKKKRRRRRRRRT